MNKEVNFNFNGENIQKVNEIGDFRENESYIINRLTVNSLLGDYFDDVDPSDRQMLSKAIYEITVGIDSNEESAKFLDRIDSTFIYHKDIKKMSKRELMCLFLNTKCAWSIVLRNNNGYTDEENVIRMRDLYHELKDFTVNELHFSIRRKLISYQDFKKHLRHHTYVQDRKTSYKGDILTAESVISLPQKVV